MSDLKLSLRKGVWQVVGTVKIAGRKTGVRVRESAGTGRLRDAEAYRDRLRQEIIDREAIGPGHALTVAGCIIIYLEKGGEKRFIGPILERFGTTRVRDLDAGEVSKFSIEHYGRLAPASVKRFFYTPLNAAIRAGCREHNIAPLTFTPPKVTRTTVEHAPEEWFPQFFAAAHFDIALTVLFLTTTGARVSEACRLTPADCQLDSERPRALLRITKTGRPRMVSLTPALVDAIRFTIEDRGLEPDDRLFGYAARWSVNQAIERVCRKAKIAYYSSHKLGRHAFAARILNNGGNLKQVQDAGGWASIQIVAEVYGHLEHGAVDATVLENSKGVAREFSNAPLSLPSGSTFVYLIAHGPKSAAWCKIGISKRPDVRLATLQVGNSAPLAMIRKWKVPNALAREIERAAHRHLESKREAGEWFTCSHDAARYAVDKAVKIYSRTTKGDFQNGVIGQSGTCLTNGPPLQSCRLIENSEKTVIDQMVGTTGIEPVTPTMSREGEAGQLVDKEPENKGYSDQADGGTPIELAVNPQATKSET